MKRVVFANRFYWPATPATGQLLTDLATALAAKGWDVTVVTSRSAAASPRVQSDRGVAIRRVWAPAGSEKGLLRKAIAFAVYAAGAWIEVWRRSCRGTIVVIMTDPPLVSFSLGLAARLRGARVVYWLQDLYPEIAAAVSGHRWVMGLRIVRDPFLSGADLCVAISEGLSQAVRDRAPDARIVVIENWAPSEVRSVPGDQAIEAYRRARGWNDVFIVGYSGNLGRVHDLEVVVEAAKVVHDTSRLKFVFVGGGPQRAALQARTRGMENVVFEDSVPRAELPLLLASIDVHLVTLRHGCELYVYPSKFYGIVAAGRPVVFVGPRECEMARAVVAGGFGVAVDSREPRELADTVVRLANDPAAVARLADRAKSKAPDYRSSVATARWEEELSQLRTCCSPAGHVVEHRE